MRYYNMQMSEELIFDTVQMASCFAIPEEPVNNMAPPTRYCHNNTNNERPRINILSPYRTITSHTHQPLDCIDPPPPEKYHRNRRDRNKEATRYTLPTSVQVDETDTQQLQFDMDEVDMMIGDWTP